MRRGVSFDLDALRTFVTGNDQGSFARAAERLARSTSAVSAHLRKLEEQAGAPLMRREGRRLVPTDAGEKLLGYARRLLDLNDEAVVAVAGARVEGWVRLALQEDFGETVLTKALGSFSRAHPAVRIEARIARNAEILEHLSVGHLDLALVWSTELSEAGPRDALLAAVPMTWIGSASLAASPPGEPVPLVVVEAPCVFRDSATAALDAAGIEWRVAFTSASLAGVWAATAAGLGVTLRSPVGLPSGVARLAPGTLPDGDRSVAIRLMSPEAAGGAEAAALLAGMIDGAVREEVRDR